LTEHYFRITWNYGYVNSGNPQRWNLIMGVGRTFSGGWQNNFSRRKTVGKIHFTSIETRKKIFLLKRL